MGRFGEADSVPPLYVVELAHEIRAALSDPKVRQQAQSEARAALEHQHEMSYRADGGGDQWRLKHAKDWPFPIEHGINEPPGCILALVALNDFAAGKPELWQPPAEFTPVLRDETLTCAGAIFDWSWRRMVDELKPEHEAKIKSVVASALCHLGSACDAIVLVTVREMAELAGLTGKAIRNRLGEAYKAGAQKPKAVQGSIGTNGAKFYSYSELRTLLTQRFPKYDARLPASLAEVESKLAKFR